MSTGLWVLVGLAAAGGLCLSALAVPIDLSFRFARHAETESRVRIAWLFGLVRKNVSGKGEAHKSSKHKKEKKPGRGPGLRAIWDSGLVQRGLRLAPGLRKVVSIRHLRLRASINAGDPYETGMAFALIGPASGALSMLPRAEVDVAPDFGDDVGVRGELEGRVRLVPIAALPPLLAFALSPGTWRGFWRLREARRR